MTASLSQSLFKDVTGSRNAPFSHDLLRRTLACIYSTAADQQDAIVAVGAALRAFEPKDEIEGMLAAQIVAAHYASFACFQYAKSSEHPDYASRYRRDAANLSRCAIDLIDGLARKRGHISKQIVRVEKVVIQEGAQAVVGAVSGGGSK